MIDLQIENALATLAGDGWKATIVVAGANLPAVPTDKDSRVVQLNSRQSMEGWLGQNIEGHSDEDVVLMMAAKGWHSLAKLQSDSPADHSRTACVSLLNVSFDAQPHERTTWYLAVQTANTTDLACLGGQTTAATDSGIDDLLRYGISLLRRGNFDSSNGGPVVSHGSARAARLVAELIEGRRSLVWWQAERQYLEVLTPSPVAILSGSFNPLHRGHRELRDAAADFLGGPISFEIPIVNADKPPLDYLTISRRVEQFTADTIALTAEPTFVGKAAIFPATVFVVGWDTARRIVDPRFYGNSERRMLEAMRRLRDLGSRFLVAGRLVKNDFLTLGDLELPTGCDDLFEELPAAAFRLDVASSQIRQDRQNR